MKRIYLLLLSALCLAASCTKPSSQEEVSDSTFVLKESIVKIGSEGGRVVCDYSISGPHEGCTAEVTSAEEWIGVSSVYSTEFTLKIGENATGKDRTGEVRLSCSGVEPLKLRVIQSAERSSEQIYSNYKITVSGITTSTCRIQVEPVNASKTYVYAVVRKADYDAMSETDYIKARISQIEEMAASYAQSPSSFLSSGNVDTDRLEASLRPSFYDRTEYYVTAFDLAYDESAKEFSYSGKIDLVEFTSASAPASSMTFTIKQGGELLTVTASNSSESFVCDYMSKEAWDELGSPDYAAHTYIYYAQAYNQFTTYTGSRVINLSTEEDITKGEKYVVYAVGYLSDDTRGGLTTEVAYLEFTY